MGRPKLSEEERAERKKSAWNPNQFRKTATNGSSDQWSAAARMLIQGQATGAQELLALLGLDEMPKSVGELQKARRKAMRKAHPDVGGSEAAAQEINHAYEQVLVLIKE